MPLLPCLRSIKVVAGPEGNGPPPEETLNEQLRVLRAAHNIQPRLEEVAFLEDVTWIADDTGFWVAVYHSMGRITYLTPKPDTRVGAIRAPQIRSTSVCVREWA